MRKVFWNFIQINVQQEKTWKLKSFMWFIAWWKLNVRSGVLLTNISNCFLIIYSNITYIICIHGSDHTVIIQTVELRDWILIRTKDNVSKNPQRFREARLYDTIGPTPKTSGIFVKRNSFFATDYEKRRVQHALLGRPTGVFHLGYCWPNQHLSYIPST